MGLFNFFSSDKNKPILSKTGLYSVNAKSIKPIEDLPKSGSYNDIAESLGFDTFHGVITFDSQKIEYIAFKRRTKEPIFVEAKDKSKALNYSDIDQIVKQIDWNFEFSQLDFDDNNK